MAAFPSTSGGLTLDSLTNVAGFDSAVAGTPYAFVKTQQGTPYTPITAAASVGVDPVGGLQYNGNDQLRIKNDNSSGDSGVGLSSDGLEIINRVRTAGDTMVGDLIMSQQTVTDLREPTGSTDATTKSYVDAAAVEVDPVGGLEINVSDQLRIKNDNTSGDSGVGLSSDGLEIINRVRTAGDTIAGDLIMSQQTVTDLREPTAPTDAATKNYVDTAVSGVPSNQLPTLSYDFRDIRQVNGIDVLEIYNRGTFGVTGNLLPFNPALPAKIDNHGRIKTSPLSNYVSVGVIPEADIQSTNQMTVFLACQTDSVDIISPLEYVVLNYANDSIILSAPMKVVPQGFPDHPYYELYYKFGPSVGMIPDDGGRWINRPVLLTIRQRGVEAHIELVTLNGTQTLAVIATPAAWTDSGQLSLFGKVDGALSMVTTFFGYEHYASELTDQQFNKVKSRFITNYLTENVVTPFNEWQLYNPSIVWNISSVDSYPPVATLADVVIGDRYNVVINGANQFRVHTSGVYQIDLRFDGTQDAPGLGVVYLSINNDIQTTREGNQLYANFGTDEPGLNRPVIDTITSTVRLVREDEVQLKARAPNPQIYTGSFALSIKLIGY